MSVFVWVVGSCLAVSGHEVLVGIDVYMRLFVILHMVKIRSEPSSVLGLARRGQRPRWSRCFPAIIVDHEPCCPMLDPL